MAKTNFKSVDEYIKTFPKDIQKILESVRQTIKNAAPDAEESISYQIPTFKLNGNLVHFAAFKNHIGFFPTSSAIKKFNQELSSYNTSKGTIRFPFDKNIPFGLIKKITKYRVKESPNKNKERVRK
jgi:uncharacterized protein YdhG (YjbR/CyaY superfamily)